MKINHYLCLGAALLILAHIAYSVESQREPLSGHHFTNGILLSSNAAALDFSVRVHSDNDQQFHYGRYVGGSTKLIMHFVSGLFGSARMRTEGVVDEQIQGLDRDVLFNSSYLSKPGSKVSLYRLNVINSNCFYAPEIYAVRCLGPERVRVAN
jgi:hypothetical protein